ncbi:MAG: DNA polymerase III subunit gamma/tau [Candidatus Amesbacteria bacterium]|nr:DNA polymerase III subunit gamma/tau [Candidatus Amesbacteria bacterium]
MASTTLYLKYRPQNIEELDLKSARDSLSKILSSKTIPHAFLFSGPRGTGKTSAARILAMTVNKLESIDTPDIIEMDAASNGGIEEIRTLREQVGLAPLSSKYKVYIIDEVHMLSIGAANALLKTLEEPPSHVIFVLCTTDPQKLPETVVSRCTRIQFARPGLAEIIAKLKIVAKGEKYKISDEDLSIIASEAKGSFRDAIKILEQVIATGVIPKTNDSEGFIALLRAKNTKASLKFIDDLVQNGVNLRTFIEKCVEVLRVELLETLNKDILAEIAGFEKAYEQSRTTAVAQLPLEVMVINIASSPATVPSTPVPVPDGDVQIILDKWNEILKVVRPFNHSVEGLLRSTKPVSFDGTNLTLEVFYKFHKDKLSEDKCRAIVEDSVATVLESPKIVLKLVLGKVQQKEDLAKVAESIFK